MFYLFKASLSCLGKSIVEGRICSGFLLRPAGYAGQVAGRHSSLREEWRRCMGIEPTQPTFR